MRIAVASSIGGSGRTSLVLNLALALTDRGHSVLMIDVDPQGCLGLILARKDDEWAGLADLLMGRVTVRKAVKRSNLPLLSLLPRGGLDPADVPEFGQAVRHPGVLEAALRNLDRHFDVILMDLPAGIGAVPRGGLAVAHEVFLTVRAEPLASRSLGRVLRLIDEVRTGENSSLALAGVVPTFFNETSRTNRKVVNQMIMAGIPVMNESIPFSDLFIRASEIGQPVRRLASLTSPELKPIERIADQVSRRVRGEDEPIRHARPVSPAKGRFHQFTSKRFEKAPPLQVPEEDLEAGKFLNLDALASRETFGSEEWAVFLDACIEATGQETAFAVDSQGLTLASRGKLGPGEIESIGTRLSIAFEQAGEMEIAAGEVTSLLAEFEHLWLTGLRCVSSNGMLFTIGILGEEPVRRSMRKEIRGSLRMLLNNLMSRMEPEETPGAMSFSDGDGVLF